MFFVVNSLDVGPKDERFPRAKLFLLLRPLALGVKSACLDLFKHFVKGPNDILGLFEEHGLG
ncbi:hypothetical protein D3C77_447920 [compost metagenome]